MPLSKIQDIENQVIPNLGRRNIIINGAMQLAQRGTSSTTNGYAALDRWVNSHGGGTVTQTQQVLSSGSPYNDGHRSFLRATNTSAGSTAASDSLQIYQVIEAQNLATCGWDSTSSSSFITMSAWVRSSLAGTYSVRLYTYDSNKNYTFQITLSANTWTKITHSIPGASGVTINNDNGAGMFVSFSVYQGTNNTDSGFTVNQWATFASGSQAPNYAQNWRATGSATFDITGVQLEVGNSASDFENRSFGEELALCQRYFVNHGLGSNADAVVSPGRDAQYTHIRGTQVQFPVAMRNAPTVVIQSSAANSMDRYGRGQETCYPQAEGITTFGFGIVRSRDSGGNNRAWTDNGLYINRAGYSAEAEL